MATWATAAGVAKVASGAVALVSYLRCHMARGGPRLAGGPRWQMRAVESAPVCSIAVFVLPLAVSAFRDGGTLCCDRCIPAVGFVFAKRLREPPRAVAAGLALVALPTRYCYQLWPRALGRKATRFHGPFVDLTETDTRKSSYLLFSPPALPTRSCCSLST